MVLVVQFDTVRGRGCQATCSKGERAPQPPSTRLSLAWILAPNLYPYGHLTPTSLLAQILKPSFRNIIHSTTVSKKTNRTER